MTQNDNKVNIYLKHQTEIATVIKQCLQKASKPQNPVVTVFELIRKIRLTNSKKHANKLSFI